MKENKKEREREKERKEGGKGSMTLLQTQGRKLVRSKEAEGKRSKPKPVVFEEMSCSQSRLHRMTAGEVAPHPSEPPSDYLPYDFPFSSIIYNLFVFSLHSFFRYMVSSYYIRLSPDSVIFSTG